MTKQPVLIIGAGFSGLTTAYYLIKNGFQVRVIEKSAKCGGLLQSHRPTQYPLALVESAANAIIASQRLEDLSKDLGLELLKAKSESKKRFFYHPKLGLTQWPLSWSETGETLLFAFKNFMSKKPRPGESLKDWAYRFVGKAMTDKVISPALSGIYGCHAKDLSVNLVLGKFFNPALRAKKANRYKGSCSYNEGLSELISALKNFVQKNGTISFNSEYDARDLARDLQNHTVILATSFKDAGQLLMGISTNLSNQIQTLETLGLVSVTCLFPIESRLKKGFGALFLEDSTIPALGVLWNDQIFNHRSDDKFCSETWIFDDRSMELSDSRLLQNILESRKKIVQKESPAPVFYQIYRWPHALPKYSSDLEEFLAQKPFEELKKQNLYFNGNYLGQIGLSNILERAYNISQEMKNA